MKRMKLLGAYRDVALTEPTPTANVVDEKIAIVDTVLGSFAPEFIERIREVIAPEKIDYVVANHVETDHSGAMPELMKLCPKAKVYCTQKCKEGLYRNYYENWDFQIVKTGDELKLGKRTLTFIEAPMIHWPDSMFTYCREEELLMPTRCGTGTSSR